MKKLNGTVLTALAMCAIVAFSGCSKKDTSGTSANAASSAEKSLNIAIVTSPSGVDDGNFNENNYNGILDFIKEHPTSKVKAIREETGDTAACAQVVQDIVADYDVIVACGFQFAGISSSAQDNPSKDFILVDTYPSDAEGNTIVVDNIYAMQFKEQESAFCTGLAAALESATKKVAVVNGIAYPSNVNYQWGFESGVNYANKKYGTNVQIVELASYAGVDVTGANVGGNYIGTFADPAKGKVVGQALIDKGVDMILVAAGGSGAGVFTAAKEAKNVKVFGCDADQFADGANGDTNICLSSALKIMGLNVHRQLNKVLDGSFKGENALLGADSGSTGYVSSAEHCLLTADTVSKVNEAYELLKNGTIVPAANFNGLKPESFTGL